MSYITKAEAARTLGMTDKSVGKLISAGAISSNAKGRPLAADIDRLVSERAQRTYTLGADAKSRAPLPIWACPISGPDRGMTLAFTQPDDITEARRHAEEDGRTDLLRSSVTFTGYWEIGEDDARTLARENGILLGVVSKYVVEAARVLDYLYSINYRQRKVFAVELLTGSELAKWKGYAPGAQQTPRFASL